MDTFFFSLLRISIAQVLKAAGFDKCRPLTLDTVTDLYIHHLQLVAASAQKFAVSRTGHANQIESPDVLQALFDVRMLGPLLLELLLGTRECEPGVETSTRLVELFVKWVQLSDHFALSRKLSEVPKALIRNLIEKRQIDTAEADQDKKKRRLRERQEFYNLLGRDADDEEVLEELSWLAYVAEKDLKLGHAYKFRHTALENSLSDYQKNAKLQPEQPVAGDHVVLLVQEAPLAATAERLESYLPYKVAYLDVVLNDDYGQTEEDQREQESIQEGTEESTQDADRHSIKSEDMEGGVDEMEPQHEPAPHQMDLDPADVDVVDHVDMDQVELDQVELDTAELDPENEPTELTANSVPAPSGSSPAEPKELLGPVKSEEI